MDMHEVLRHFEQTGVITDDIVEHLEENQSLRQNLVEFFRKQSSHDFPAALLKDLSARRKQDSEPEISAEILMFGAYLLAMRRDETNALLLWEVKCADFDTYCCFDSELVASAGLAKTLAYLENHPSDLASQAADYFREPWNVASPEAEINRYFQEDNLPYYI